MHHAMHHVQRYLGAISSSLFALLIITDIVIKLYSDFDHLSPAIDFMRNVTLISETKESSTSILKTRIISIHLKFK